MTDIAETTDLAIPDAPQDWAVAPADTAARAPATTTPPVSSLLRGRYRWAVGIGALLAAGGAAAGALVPKPLYRSVGLVDIAPKVPRVLYESDEKGLLPNFDAYVASQASLAGTRRIVDMAMASPEWRKLGREVSDPAVAVFQQHLSVSHPKYTEHVEVAFVDEDPEAAMVAVNQVIKAYMTIVEERESRSGTSTQQVLENQRSLATGELTRLRKDVLSVTDDLGEQALATRYDFDITQMNKMDTTISDLDVEIALGKAALESRPDGAGSHVLTPQDIAVKDATMEQLLQQKGALEGKQILLSERDGLGPKHPAMLAVAAELKVVDGLIEGRTQAFRAANVPQNADTLRESEARRARLAELREKLQAEATGLAQKRVTLANLEQERSLQTERLDGVRKRLEQIDVESETHGRISVIAFGDRPVEPDTDRRVALSLLGGGGGMGLGFALVLLWGLREAKVRHLVDVDQRRMPCRFLGVVPEVRDDGRSGTEDDPAVLGDYCVHHLRAILQLRAEDRPRIIAVTSPTPAAGKTTLTLALGMSFAAAGARTLLVDCDFVGHGLTSSMRSLVCEGATRALTDGYEDVGDAPRRGLMAGLIEARRLEFDDAHVRELLDATRGRARSRDDSFARTATALEALARPGSPGTPRGGRGIDGALAGAPLERCVVDTCVPNLSLLPVGDVVAGDAERVSRAGLRRLVENCRGQFDTILVDTGPILGSLETIFVAAAVDDVLLVVSRGERRPRIDESLTRLSQIGAVVAGTVFNRATTADVVASSYASRSQSRPAGVA